ncbi:MAG: DnaJ domain-containing protein, partial [Elusimicrobia bacterium]|nr:DnaJ domain-containing protein [Elusimicrobiota bacterium]
HGRRITLVSVAGGSIFDEIFGRVFGEALGLATVRDEHGRTMTVSLLALRPADELGAFVSRVLNRLWFADMAALFKQHAGSQSRSPQPNRPALDYYKTLGATKDMTREEIRKLYRRLSLENHPDRHPGDAQREEAFKAISVAWGVLGDSDKRDAYDQTLP